MKNVLQSTPVTKFPAYAIRLLIFVSASAILPLNGIAQEKNDSASVDLKEVVVEGKMQSASAEKVTYKPSARAKNASQNAIDLLGRMAIPQLKVDLMTSKVSTAGGEELAIFINYAPATKEDITGMKMSDVRSVEYLDFPTDPRFRGAQHAVNIIVQEYEYGGYTKVSDRQFFLSDFSNYGAIFSKFAFRKMTYDLYMASDNVSSTNIGQSQFAKFSLPTVDVTRNQDFISSDFKYVTIPVTFRAIYGTDKLRISNTLGYEFNDRYRNISNGRLSFTPSNGTDYTYQSNAPHINRTLSWVGNYYFSLPKGWSLTADPSFTYTHRNSYNTYTTSLPGSDPIVNNARENAYNTRLSVNARKIFGKIHTLSLDAMGRMNINNVAYSGSSPYFSDFSSYAFSAKASYTLSLQKCRLNAAAGVIGEFINANENKYNDLYPNLHFDAVFAPNSKNYMSMSIHYATTSPELAEHSPNVIQSNELLFRTGNPLIKNNRNLSSSINYTFLPSNNLSFSTYASYYGAYNRAVTVYEPYNDGKALIMTYRNSGDYTVLNFGMNATLRLLGNSLVFQASPYFGRAISSGYINDSHNVFGGSISGQYYIGNFNITAAYSARTHNLNENTGAYITTRCQYYLQAGWSKNLWNLSAYIVNPFISGYDGMWSELNTPLYSYRVTTFNGNNRRAFCVSATYTFGYGKKLQRGDEAGRQSSAGSAIM